MFYGSYEHSVDSKNRVIVPKAFREELGDKFYVTAGIEKCLYILPEKSFNEMVERLSLLPSNDEDSQDMIRHIMFSASSCEVDKQGRILLSPAQKKYAGIDNEDNKDVVFGGMINKIEIWCKNVREEVSESLNISAKAKNASDNGFRF